MKITINSPELIYPELSYSIIGSAMNVHNELGPGWDEWDYHRAMVEDLTTKGHQVESHERKNLVHRGKVVDHFELDILVDGLIILELKHIRSAFLPEHYTQIINYLKCWEKRLGILINYGLERLSYKRVPYDPVYGRVKYVGKWDELKNQIPMLCQIVSKAVDSTLQQHGSGYGVNVYKKLLLAELNHRGSYATFPIFSPTYGMLRLGERALDSILVDSNLLISISATGTNASSSDLACLKSYMRQIKISHGLLIDVGSPDIQLKGVL